MNIIATLGALPIFQPQPEIELDFNPLADVMHTWCNSRCELGAFSDYCEHKEQCAEYCLKKELT